MATEITRTAGPAASEQSAAAPVTTDIEETIQTEWHILGGVVQPVDPTAGGGLDTGYAAEDTAPSPSAPEDSAPAQA